MDVETRQFLVTQLVERRNRAIRLWHALGRLIAALGNAEQLAEQHEIAATLYRDFASDLSAETVAIYQQVDGLDPATVTPEEIERLEYLASAVGRGQESS